ncbi:MAG: sigma-70 family RNA polymerase sigma factor [Candidatus Latescibacteria bacterium]|nr:sigma-70 family RNA polymerase sigma factor [Candidatus Latescibacterota bacterium]
MQITDQQLIGRITERDAHAFEQFFARYRQQIHHHVRRIVGDQLGADDVVQEVFLRVWNRAGQWSGEGSVAGWLFRIATNLSLTHLRTVRRRREQRLETPSATVERETHHVPEWMVEAASQRPDRQLERADQRHWLRRQVQDLPEDKREVFRLVYDAQVEVREAAQRLGIPEGTVKSRLHHGRRQLQQAWRATENEEEH